MFGITKKQLAFYLLYIAILGGIGTTSGAFILRDWRIGAAIGFIYGTGYVGLIELADRAKSTEANPRK
jgi:hypothetical protein